MEAILLGAIWMETKTPEVGINPNVCGYIYNTIYHHISSLSLTALPSTLWNDENYFMLQGVAAYSPSERAQRAKKNQKSFDVVPTYSLTCTACNVV